MDHSRKRGSGLRREGDAGVQACERRCAGDMSHHQRPSTRSRRAAHAGKDPFARGPAGASAANRRRTARDHGHAAPHGHRPREDGSGSGRQRLDPTLRAGLPRARMLAAHPALERRTRDARRERRSLERGANLDGCAPTRHMDSSRAAGGERSPTRSRTFRGVGGRQCGGATASARAARHRGCVRRASRNHDFRRSCLVSIVLLLLDRRRAYADLVP